VGAQRAQPMFGFGYGSQQYQPGLQTFACGTNSSAPAAAPLSSAASHAAGTGVGVLVVAVGCEAAIPTMATSESAIDASASLSFLVMTFNRAHRVPRRHRATRRDLGVVREIGAPNVSVQQARHAESAQSRGHER
jgi:hypothetical protein